MRTGAARIAGMTLAAALALTVTGCKDDPEPPPDFADGPRATPGASASEAAAREEILRAYTAYRAAVTAAYNAGNHLHPDLDKHLADPLLAQTRSDLYNLGRQGLVYKGAIKTNPKVTQVKLSEATPTAIIEDCFDLSDYKLIVKSSGAPAPNPPSLTRFAVNITATRFTGRNWLISNSEMAKERSC